MTKRAKQLCIVILAQSCCIAVGLWMEQQYVKTSVRRAAEDQAWSEIEVFTSNLQARLAALTPESLLPDSPELDQIRVRLTASHPSRGGSLIVDRDWRVVAQGDVAHLPLLEPGYQISRTQIAGPSPETSFISRFTLELPDGPHVAGVGTLRGSAGYVVVHRPQADLAATSSTLVSSLPALGGVTLVWMCALLGFVVYLVLSRFHDEIDRERKQTAADSLRRTQNLVRTRDAVIFGLAQLADSRDPETGDHLERISIYSTTLASALRRHSQFDNQVTPAFVRLIGISSALHDIGKVGIEDRILRKAGTLTKEEVTRMQQHAAIGGECLQGIEHRLGSSNFLQMAREIAFSHHERWDGTGYPRGVAGEEIPLAARIAAIVDVYDALSSRRVYKPRLPHEECVAIIRDQAGRHFDPDLVSVWLTIEPRFREIAAQYAEVSSDMEPPDTSQGNREVEQEQESEELVSAVLAGQR